jgi:alpha-glucosidase
MNLQSIPIKPLAKYFSLLLAGPILAIIGAPIVSAAELKSPDGRIVVSVSTTGPLKYSVRVNGTPVVNESRLGLRFHGGAEIGDAVSLIREEREHVDTMWTNPLGKHSSVRDNHSELRLFLRENGSRAGDFEVIFRAFDDGIGFRYALPSRNSGNVQIDDELTEFAFTADNVCYAGEHTTVPPEEYDSRGGFAGSQEWEFLKKRLSDVSDETVTGLPLLTRTPAAWVAVTEADLYDWSGLWLRREPQSGGTTAVTLKATLAPRLDGQGLVKISLPHVSPWRVLIIGDKPGKLVESEIVLNLSTPNKIADPSWVRPGMMAWDRWWSGMGKMDTATMKLFIQFASEMGWPYQLVDGGWYVRARKADSDITRAIPQVDMPELLRFAAEKKVRLWVWLYWTDVDRDDAYKNAFALYEKWGVAGVKIDFMDRDDQDMVNWYEKITREAAKHHLLVDFHGAFKPTGMIRTWPNQITREGILGNEYNKWSMRQTAEHRATLPFTRFLAGPGDFTPGGFVNRSAATFQTHVTPTQVQSTRAGQLALFVAYDSPVMCVCDHPDNMRGQPGLDFLKLVPTVWDDTRVLSGSVGEYLVIVRRSGKNWFLGSLTNGHRRVCTAKLDFLGAGKWTMRWWHDAADSSDNAEHIEIDERVVTSRDSVNLKMADGGGSVAEFVRLSD